jgi:hypothetical protein
MSLGLELRPREPWPALAERYRLLDGLIASALDALATGDRETGLILAAGAVAKTHVLDERLGLQNLRDDGGQGRPPGLFRSDDVHVVGARSRRSR